MYNCEVKKIKLDNKIIQNFDLMIWSLFKFMLNKYLIKQILTKFFNQKNNIIKKNKVTEIYNKENIQDIF